MPEHTIAENLTRLQNATTAIGNAITAKGGTVSSGDGLEEFASDIATIPSGGVEFSNTPAAFTLLSNIQNLDVIIPSGVTSIADNAFYYCTGLTSIEIQSGVTSIGQSAFYGCTNLASVEIPNSVTSIGSSAFQGCSSLSSITISNSVTSISQNTFYDCDKLKYIEIPASVTNISAKAFDDAGLQTIKFLSSTPPTVSNSNAFRYCPISTIYVPTGSLTAYTSASNYPSSSSVNYVEY